MKRNLLFLFLFISGAVMAQPEVYPPHWWSGMKTNSIQLMLYGKEIGIGKPAVSVKYPGVTLTKVHYVENSNYLFVDLTIGAKAAPGKLTINIKQASKSI